jgi:hypothetical protein
LQKDPLIKYSPPGVWQRLAMGGKGWQRVAKGGGQMAHVDTNYANEYELSRHRHHTRVPIENSGGVKGNSPG